MLTKNSTNVIYIYITSNRLFSVTLYRNYNNAHICLKFVGHPNLIEEKYEDKAHKDDHKCFSFKKQVRHSVLLLFFTS